MGNDWQRALGRQLSRAREIAGLAQTAVGDAIRATDPGRQRKKGDIKRVGTQTVSRLEAGAGVNTNFVAAYLRAIGADLKCCVLARTQDGQRIELGDELPAGGSGDSSGETSSRGAEDLTEDIFGALRWLWNRLPDDDAREAALARMQSVLHELRDAASREPERHKRHAGKG